MGEIGEQSWPNEEWLLASVPSEAIVALNALYGIVEDDHNSEELRRVPALTANVLVDSDEPVQLTVGELLAIQLKASQVGAFILHTHGIIAQDAVDLLVHRYPKVAIRTTHNYVKVMAAIRRTARSQLDEGEVFTAIMRAAHTQNARTYKQCRNEVLMLGQRPEYHVSPSQPIQWRDRALEAYLSGQLVRDIARSNGVSPSAVTHMLDRRVEKHAGDEKPPKWYPRLVELRSQKTHGGDRGRNQWKRWS